VILSTKIKPEIQNFILQYVEILYKDVLMMTEGTDPPIPYQIIFLPDDLKEMWVMDNTNKKMIRIYTGMELLIADAPDEEGYVKIISDNIPRGYAEIPLKYIKQIGYN